MGIVIAMSGRVGAGKNTIGSFARTYYAQEIWRKHNTGDKDEILEFGGQRHQTLRGAHKNRIQELRDRLTMECSFADNLKEFCIDTLGLTREQCYGSDEQKCSPTSYNWDMIDPYIRWKFGTRDVMENKPSGGVQSRVSADELTQLHFTRLHFYSNLSQGYTPLDLRSGPITAREIMQLFGTELIRETFGNVWAKATIRRIKNTGKEFAVITDNRFPNEIEEVLAEPHGYIIRLTRAIHGSKDLHPSEASLDNFDWTRERCHVLDNEKMSIEEQNEAVIPILDKIFAL